MECFSHSTEWKLSQPQRKFAERERESIWLDLDYLQFQTDFCKIKDAQNHYAPGLCTCMHHLKILYNSGSDSRIRSPFSRSFLFKNGLILCTSL